MKVLSVVLVAGSAWVPTDVFSGNSKRSPADGTDWSHSPGEPAITVRRGQDVVAAIPTSACLVINYEVPKPAADLAPQRGAEAKPAARKALK